MWMESKQIFRHVSLAKWHGLYDWLLEVSSLLTMRRENVPLDVSHHLESIELNTRLSSQGSQSLIRQNDPSIFRLLQIVPLDVVPDKSHSLWPCSHGPADDGSQHIVNKEPPMQVLVATMWTSCNSALSLPSSSSEFGSIFLPDQVVAVVECWLGLVTSHFLFFSQELNSTQLMQMLLQGVCAFSQNLTHHEI